MCGIGTRPAAGWQSLVHSFGPRDPLVNRLAPGKAFLHAMPMGNRFLAKLPAEQDGLSFDLAGKIEQPDIKILDLHSDGIDFGERIFEVLFGFYPFGLAAGQRENVEKHSTIQENAVMQRLLLGIEFFHRLLGRESRAQQRFENRK